MLAKKRERDSERERRNEHCGWFYLLFHSVGVCPRASTRREVWQLCALNFSHTSHDLGLSPPYKEMYVFRTIHYCTRLCTRGHINWRDVLQILPESNLSHELADPTAFLILLIVKGGILWIRKQDVRRLRSSPAVLQQVNNGTRIWARFYTTLTLHQTTSIELALLLSRNNFLVPRS